MKWLIVRRGRVIAGVRRLKYPFSRFMLHAMSNAHLAELRIQLERRNWIVVSQTQSLEDASTLNWKIARPNGGSVLTIEFTPGSHGAYGDFRHESIEESIACNVDGHPEIPFLYFGKFLGQYQKDVVAFSDAINLTDRDFTV